MDMLELDLLNLRAYYQPNDIHKRGFHHFSPCMRDIVGWQWMSIGQNESVSEYCLIMSLYAYYAISRQNKA